MPFPDLKIKPIGIIRTPFRDVSENIPVQGRLHPGVPGRIELLPGYQDACRDLDGFSHIFLLYYFHLSTEERTITRPYLDTEPRGVFSTRSPHRPNHIGLSLVSLIGVSPEALAVSGVDMVDGSPLLDIKPYNPRFDATAGGEDIRTGWMQKLPAGTFSGESSFVRSREGWSQ